MSNPAQMFDHELNGVKGFIPASPWVVDKALDLHADITDPSTVNAGAVVHMDPSTSTWKLGRGTVSRAGTTAPMPFLVFQNGDDFDVLGDNGNITGAADSGAQRARVMGVAVNMGAEIESTEFEDADYEPGDLLDADATTGKLQLVATSGAAMILGVVSDGIIQSEHGDRAGSNIKQLLRFHTCFHPLFA